jgi:hypothetical protein
MFSFLSINHDILFVLALWLRVMKVTIQNFEFLNSAEMYVKAGKAMGGALYHGAKQVDSQLKALLFLFFAAGFSAGMAVALCAVSFKASRAKQGTIADVQAVPTVAVVAGTVFSPDQVLVHIAAYFSLVLTFSEPGL